MFIGFIFLILSFQYINLSAADKYKCRNKDINREIEIGDEVTLCLHSKEENIKIAYKLKVDDYSIFTIEGAFQKLIKEKQNQTQEASTQESREQTRYQFRNMLKEPNNNNKYVGIEDNPEIINSTDIYTTEKITSNTIGITTTKNTIINSTNIETTINTEENITNSTSDIPTDETPEEEEEEENTNDKAKFVAQIGDKFTQYPSVIFLYNIYFYINKYSYTGGMPAILIKFLLYLALWLKSRMEKSRIWFGIMHVMDVMINAKKIL